MITKPHKNARSNLSIPRPEGAYVTVLPRSDARLRKVVKAIPFRDLERCNDCALHEYCGRNDHGCSILVWEILGHELRRDCSEEPLISCVVIPWGEVEENAHKGPLYLVDANVLLHAFNDDSKHGKASWWVLKSKSIRIATTKGVLREVKRKNGYKLPRKLKIIDDSKIDPGLSDIQAAWGHKQPSQVDLGLISTAAHEKDIKGIITFDRDFKSVATEGMVKKLTGRTVKVLNAFEVRRKYAWTNQ